jgi:hypothetical protein
MSVALCAIQKEVLIGVVLGDASLERRKITHNTRLRLEQGHPKNTSYLWHLYGVFCNITGNTLLRFQVRKPDKRTGKVYSTTTFTTLSLPCLNVYRDLFYPEGVKIVPAIIGSLLTPMALAYWIADDGSLSSHNQTVLHTDGFTLSDVNVLRAVLLDRFKLRTRIVEKRPGQFLILIPVRQEVSL